MDNNRALSAVELVLRSELNCNASIDYSEDSSIEYSKVIVSCTTRLTRDTNKPLNLVP